MSKKEKEETKEKPVEESEAVKVFRATWEAYKLQDPEKYAIKVANGEIEKQLELLVQKEKDDAAITLKRSNQF